MTPTVLHALVRKELLLLSRDLHGLLLLFIMPLVFILVMSLAMRDQYASHAGRPIDVVVIDRAESVSSRALLDTLARNEGYRIEVAESERQDDIARRLNKGDHAFLLDIRSGLDDFVRMTSVPDDSEPRPVAVVTLPAHTSRQQEKVFEGLLQEALSRVQLTTMMEDLIARDNDMVAMSRESLMGEGAIALEYLYGDDPHTPPSAVQQNVPAWLIFSIFFIVVPLSNTFINERLLGTVNRMRTMRVSPAALILGKLIPYFAVNQMQVVLMLLTGVYIVPLLGGDALVLNGAFAGLTAMSLSVSWAALGYALMIAVVARTPEQAVTLGGMGNIILAAIGGIMVPVFIMPDMMQWISNISPMAWALQGFLDVLLRGGGWTLIAPKIGLLTLFGTICMFLAVMLYSRVC